jgi:hypothetical protein
VILAVIGGLVVVLWRVSGDGDLPDQQETMSALVGTNADLLVDTAPTLTVLATTLEAATSTPAGEEMSPLPTGQMVVYLVAPEGSTGPLGPFGCGNYLVPVAVGDYPPTTTDKQIAYALLELLSIKDQFYGESGLYSVLYQSNLTLESVTVDDATGQATIKITGDLLLAGECSDPLVQAQIEQTALQFAASGVSIFINDQPLADVLSGRGTTG